MKPPLPDDAMDPQPPDLAYVEAPFYVRKDGTLAAIPCPRCPQMTAPSRHWWHDYSPCAWHDGTCEEAAANPALYCPCGRTAIRRVAEPLHDLIVKCIRDEISAYASAGIDRDELELRMTHGFAERFFAWASRNYTTYSDSASAIKPSFMGVPIVIDDWKYDWRVKAHPDSRQQERAP